MNILERLTPSQKNILATHNSRSFTRRDFIGLGLQTAACTTLLSSLKLKLARATPQLTPPPFIVFDLVGGAALPGNFLVGGSGGSLDLLPSYETLGFNPRTAELDQRFGLPAPKNTSQFFEGLLRVVSSEAQSGLRLASIAHQSVDDSSNNTTSGLGHVAKYWSQLGLLKQNGLGTTGTDSGGRTQNAMKGIRPELLSSLDQLNTLAGLGYMVKDGIKPEMGHEIVTNQLRIYQDQFKNIFASEQTSKSEYLADQFKNFMTGLREVPILDPRLLDNTREIFSLRENSPATGEVSISAGIANSTLIKFTGPSCIALNGFDYHDGTQNTGDAADLRAGRMVGSIIELAHRLGTPFFFQVLTDGSCSARGDRNWSADSGDRGLTLMGFYHPRKVEQLRTQIGQYTAGQIADISTYVGQRTQNVAHTVFLNYLASFAAEGEIHQIITENELPKHLIDSHLAFAGSRE